VENPIIQSVIIVINSVKTVHPTTATRHTKRSFTQPLPFRPSRTVTPGQRPPCRASEHNTGCTPPQHNMPSLPPFVTTPSNHTSLTASFCLPPHGGPDAASLPLKPLLNKSLQYALTTSFGSTCNESLFSFYSCY
jgi:hypothetical protein